MKAAVYEQFQGRVTVCQVEDPAPPDTGVVIRVGATGVCRSDWHGWMGHDSDIALPHVPGHELAGMVEAVGKDVRLWRAGDRVTVPFVCGCGCCEQCQSGNHQICDNQTQPGFTHWGSYAEYVAIEYADINLVAVPAEIEYATAAILGCRFATSFRAIVAQGKPVPGHWVAVHGCGGIGLSAIMIARALDMQVVAIDVDDQALKIARDLGATATVNGRLTESVVEEVVEITSGGAQLSLDAAGNRQACFNSIANLRKHGCHVQVGLLAGDDFQPPIPMELVIRNELEIVGSHGMQAFEYGNMLQMVQLGKLRPDKLIRQTIDLERAAASLGDPDDLRIAGVTVIDLF